MKQLSLHLSDVTEQIIVLVAFAYICRQRHKICIVLKDFFFQSSKGPFAAIYEEKMDLVGCINNAFAFK